MSEVVDSIVTEYELDPRKFVAGMRKVFPDYAEFESLVEALKAVVAGNANAYSGGSTETFGQILLALQQIVAKLAHGAQNTLDNLFGTIHFASVKAGSGLLTAFGGLG